MNKLSWTMKPSWKSVWFEGPFLAGSDQTTVSFSVDVVYGAFTDHMSSGYGTRDIVYNGLRRKVRLSSRCSWATTFGWVLST